MTRMMTLALAGASLIAQPAQAACWSPAEVAAAKVRDLDAMLMVSALRCRTTNVAVLDRYNAFVTQDRAALVAVNAVLRGHFEGEVGKARALDAYDNYVTAIANHYGAGAEGLGCDDMASIVDAAMAEGATGEALQAVAERAAVQPRLDGEGACAAPVVMASAAP